MGTWTHLTATFNDRRRAWQNAGQLTGAAKFPTIAVVIGTVGIGLAIAFVPWPSWEWAIVAPVLYTYGVFTAQAVLASLPPRFRNAPVQRAITWAVWSAGFTMSIVELVIGVVLAVAVSVALSKVFATAVLWFLNAPSKVDGTYTAAAHYLILTASLTILAHGKRWVVIPAIKLFNFPARGEGHLLYERTLIRGILAIDFRRRAYELGIVLLAGSILSEFGAFNVADLPFGVGSKAIFVALVTFLAIDTYLTVFLPKHVLDDHTIDVEAIQSKIVPRRRDGSS